MSKNILIIDDDATCTTIERSMLEGVGYVVRVAVSAADGLTQARADKPDLIVLDLLIRSDSEGFEVSRQIATAPDLKGIPVLLVTGVRKAFHLPFALEPDPRWLPVAGVLEKPLQNGRLVKVVEGLIGV